MFKQELLQEMRRQLETGELSRDEIQQVLGVAMVDRAEKKSSIFSITNILYVLGAAIVIIGIIFFVGQIWFDIGSFGRVLVTLGLGFLFAAIGSMLLQQQPKVNLGVVFHFLGGMLIPSGAMVLLDEIDLIDSEWTVALVMTIIFVFYMLLVRVHRHAILTFFAIANGTMAAYLIMNAILPVGMDEDIFAYMTMAFGIGYVALAHRFSIDWNHYLVGILSFFGSIGFYAAAFSRIFRNGFWEMLYPLLTIGGLFLSIKLKSRSLLVVSTCFLIAYVTYITSEYFADSLGWPVTLVLLGFAFIGLGYMSVRINKKYIA
jgi:hypothetical protein